MINRSLIKLGSSKKALDIHKSIGMLKDTISELMGKRFGYENLSFSRDDVRKLLFQLQTLRGHKLSCSCNKCRGKK